MKCACCGKNVRKWTTTVYLEKERSKFHTSHTGSRYIYPDELGIPWPKTLAECQKLSNQKVTSIERRVYWKDTGPRYEKERAEFVRKFTEWDGETYLPRYTYFCSNTCAGTYAQALVRELRARKITPTTNLKGATR